MASKRIRGIELFYDDQGQGAALVFIHGHPFNRTMWAEQAAYFSRDWRVVMPDLRGYGETKAVTTRTLLDEMALDIIHLLDELGIGKAVFCGLSMGGQIVLDLYRMFPQRVAGLVIADSDARGESPESYTRRLALAETLLKDGMPAYTKGHIHEYIAPASLAEPRIHDRLFAMMSATSAEGAAAAHRGRAERRDHLALLPKIDVPLLVVVGSGDYFTPLPIARLIADPVPGAELAVIEGAGHIPNMEKPVEFNRVLERFLGRVRKMVW